MDVSTNYRNSFAISLFKMQAAIMVFLFSVWKWGKLWNSKMKFKLWEQTRFPSFF